MRPTLTSLRSPQGQPGPADTKRLPGRHPHVMHVPDTPTMLRDSERLEVPLELMTTGQPQGENPLRRRRVLVVGWEIFNTGARAHALEHVRDVHPDVILLDIRGRQLDGWEVYRRLKEDQETRAIPVIMVVGRGEEGDEMRGFEAGADAVVILP